MAAYHSNQQMLLIPRLVYIFYLLQGYRHIIIDYINIEILDFVQTDIYLGYSQRVQCWKLASILERIPPWNHSKDARKSKIDTIS